ncbi:hypothetical protein ACRBEV_10985 [Methylobacterium phyllosphaerae]
MTLYTHSVPTSSDIWDGTQQHPLAEFAPFKFELEERITLIAAYNAQGPRAHFSESGSIWLDLNYLLSQHRARLEDWESAQPKTVIDQMLSGFDERLELNVCDIEKLMFNDWLSSQFGPDRELWATLRTSLEEARTRIQVYRSQIEGKRFKRSNRRKLQKETTFLLQNILSRYGLSLVTPGETLRLDIRRGAFLRRFFEIAKDPIDDVRERTLLTPITEALRRK